MLHILCFSLFLEYTPYSIEQTLLDSALKALAEYEKIGAECVEANKWIEDIALTHGKNAATTSRVDRKDRKRARLCNQICSNITTTPIDLNSSDPTDQTHFISIDQSIVESSDSTSQSQSKSTETTRTRSPEDALETTFSAIILPSYSGKTQLPYSFRIALALYFVCSGCQNDSGQQPIYQNFTCISNYLNELAVEDLAAFRFRSDSSPYISTTLLSSQRNQIPSLVLGFLYKIMEMDINFKFPENEESGLSWMSHHAQRPSFMFEKLSISEFKEKIGMDLRFKNYFVFLDEFKAFDWAVFVRNLIRAVGMWCIVASTNTQIANLTGIDAATRDDHELKYPPVWCLIQLELAPTVPSFLSECKRIKQVLLNRCNNEQYESLSNVMDYFANQMTKARPGLAKKALQLLKMIEDFNRPIPANIVFQTVISGVAEMIEKSKRTISSVSGCITNLFVHLDQPYSGPNLRPVDKISVLARNAGGIHEHLFSLRHGIQSSGSRHSTIDIDIRLMPIYSIRDQDALSLSNLRFGANLCNWEPTAYLNKTESLLTLACMSIKPKYTVITLARKDIFKLEEIFLDSKNPEALALNGNHLEVVVTLSTVISSHTIPVANDTFKVTYEGVLGHFFIQNFTRNLFFNPATNNPTIDKSFDHPYVFKFSPKLKLFLSQIRVPFLYAANMPIPTKLQKAFPLRNSKSPIRIGTFKRTPDKSQIDGVFDLCLEPSFSNNYSTLSSIGIIEAKHWKSSLDIGDYSSIVKKALDFGKDSVSLHLLVCLEVTNFKSPKKLCDTYPGCNFYLVLVEKFKKFPIRINLKPLGKEHPNPKHVFIIFAFKKLLLFS